MRAKELEEKQRLLDEQRRRIQEEKELIAKSREQLSKLERKELEGRDIMNLVRTTAENVQGIVHDGQR